MSRQGFSLLEVLIVIAIIALLLGVLSPSLWSARQQAQSIICASNVEQLIVALAIYEQTHERFPNGFDDKDLLHRPGPPGGYPGVHGEDKPGWWWFHQLDGIMVKDPYERDSVLWCASRKVKDPGLLVNVLLGNYGVNRAICMDVQGAAGCEFVGRPLASAQILRPAATLLLADSGYSLVSWHAAADSVIQRAVSHERREGAFYVPGLSINGNRIFSGTFKEDAVEGRHYRGTINVAYADGHGDRVNADRLLVEDVGGCWRNRSGLWLP